MHTPASCLVDTVNKKQPNKRFRESRVSLSNAEMADGSAAADGPPENNVRQQRLPARFQRPGLQDYESVRRDPSNPFYTTTYNDYGRFSPTVHTVTRCFHGKSQRPGQEQYVRGMYRDRSLNM